MNNFFNLIKRTLTDDIHKYYKYEYGYFKCWKWLFQKTNLGEKCIESSFTSKKHYKTWSEVSNGLKRVMNESCKIQFLKQSGTMICELQTNLIHFMRWKIDFCHRRIHDTISQKCIEENIHQTIWPRSSVKSRVPHIYLKSSITYSRHSKEKQGLYNFLWIYLWLLWKGIS